MDVPKGFKPDDKDLDKNMERLLDEKSVKKSVPTKIEEALKDYISGCEHSRHIMPVPDLLKHIKEIEDLGSYVRKLTDAQLDGEVPLIRLLSSPQNQTHVTYDLYWSPEKDRLEFDWDDTPGAGKRLYQFKTEISLGLC